MSKIKGTVWVKGEDPAAIVSDKSLPMFYRHDYAYPPLGKCDLEIELENGEPSAIVLVADLHDPVMVNGQEVPIQELRVGAPYLAYGGHTSDGVDKILEISLACKIMGKNPELYRWEIVDD